jgi:hypothetical protein
MPEEYTLEFLTERQMRVIVRALRNYIRTSENVIEKVSQEPEGPCYPHTPGTVNPWAKQTVIDIYNEEKKTAIKLVEIIEKKLPEEE